MNPNNNQTKDQANNQHKGQPRGQHKNRYKDRYYLQQYWAYLQPYKWSLRLGFALIPLLSIFHILQPLLLKHGIDNNILKGDLVGLKTTAILYGSCLFLEFCCRSLQGLCLRILGNPLSPLFAPIYVSTFYRYQ